MKIFHFALAACLFTGLTAREKNTQWILEHLETIPDFPKPGIAFKSISPLLRNPAAFKRVIGLFADRYRNEQQIDAIVALDARGFLFGSALAYELEVPLVMMRKGGKLPGDVLSVSYSLEYGKDLFEMQKGALAPGQKVVIIDDLIATGGTICAAGELIEKQGAQVCEVAVLIELEGLNGRSKIPYPLFSLIPLQ